VSFLGKLFKKPYEKEFIDGTRELFRQDFAKAYERYNQSYTLNNLCFDACLVLSMLSFKLGDSATAQNFLEYVLNSGVRKFPLIDQYLGPAVLHFEYPITENVRADFTLGVRAAYLMLAEIYQDQGRVEEAVDLLYGAMQQGYSDPLVKLSLVELLNDLERDEEIISLAQGTTNENNVSLATMFYLGQAMMRKGYNDAAIEILKSALAKRKDRDEQLLLEIRYLLARVYAESGRKAQAKKHYEQILAKDYGFRDVRERLESLRMDR
jgi:tetratricopeptide (TPR) repeat protein